MAVQNMSYPLHVQALQHIIISYNFLGVVVLVNRFYLLLPHLFGAIKAWDAGLSQFYRQFYLCWLIKTIFLSRQYRRTIPVSLRSTNQSINQNQKNPKGQSRTDNREILATLGIRLKYEDKQNIKYNTENYIKKKMNNTTDPTNTGCEPMCSRRLSIIFNKLQLIRDYQTYCSRKVRLFITN